MPEGASCDPLSHDDLFVVGQTRPVEFRLVGRVVIGEGDQDSDGYGQEDNKEGHQGCRGGGEEGEAASADSRSCLKPVGLADPPDHAFFDGIDIPEGLVKQEEAHEQEEDGDQALNHEDDGPVKPGAARRQGYKAVYPLAPVVTPAQRIGDSHQIKEECTQEEKEGFQALAQEQLAQTGQGPGEPGDQWPGLGSLQGCLAPDIRKVGVEDAQPALFVSGQPMPGVADGFLLGLYRKLAPADTDLISIGQAVLPFFIGIGFGRYQAGLVGLFQGLLLFCQLQLALLAEVFEILDRLLVIALFGLGQGFLGSCQFAQERAPLPGHGRQLAGSLRVLLVGQLEIIIQSGQGLVMICPNLAFSGPEQPASADGISFSVQVLQEGFPAVPSPAEHDLLIRKGLSPLLPVVTQAVVRKAGFILRRALCQQQKVFPWILIADIVKYCRGILHACPFPLDSCLSLWMLITVKKRPAHRRRVRYQMGD